ncbi:glutathione S-transferase family protein [Mesorhizobium sp. B2-3-4]|uniref:glutathione S-transferase family protein n=1 Tax=Mesorhizobium sp. B2-3-4 TaxID=2589959 RepID=UPI00112B045A|nr:glutathione S-transferase family protein [Mesorhizobium sp. B2-3-4]TPM36144.1 glutathione S-transferase family protein [Mesorhizobium sp. B2-3-4]
MHHARDQALHRLWSLRFGLSVPIEAALELLKLPYRVEECSPWESEEQADKLRTINPMIQVPALVLPSGRLMTESAAILIWLADNTPEGRLAPALSDPARGEFLRWMTFVSSAVYALYWIADNPSRVLERPEDHEEIRARLFERIARCWAFMGNQLRPGRYLLGQELSVLDLYVATASRWSPGRRRFNEVAPSLADAVSRVDADPRLASLWSHRYPFAPGWER